MAAKTKDLRTAAEDIERVKQAVCKTFGFRDFMVKPVEADVEDPSRHCVFEVCGVTYEVTDGVISVVPAED